MKQILYNVDADGICMTNCPFGYRTNNCQYTCAVGSYAESVWCPYFHGDTGRYIKCGFPTKKKGGTVVPPSDFHRNKNVAP